MLLLCSFQVFCFSFFRIRIKLRAIPNIILNIDFATSLCRTLIDARPSQRIQPRDILTTFVGERAQL